MTKAEYCQLSNLGKISGLPRARSRTYSGSGSDLGSRSHTAAHIRRYCQNNRRLLQILQNHSFRYDLRKHFISARIVNVWNSLPNSVVDACTISAFKARLDKFWQHRLVKFNLTLRA